MGETIMKNTACPSSHMLSAFVIGRTTESEAVAIETHLNTCPDCLNSLDQSSEDPLVAAVKVCLPAIKDGVESLNSDLSGIERPLIDRERETQVLPTPSNDVETSPSVAGFGDTVEHYRFLTPPEDGRGIGRLGPYRILEQIGSGGMGAVFRAEDPQLQRPLALKVMRAHSLTSPGAHERFLIEARAVAKLKHDNVVTIYQVGEDRGVAFIAMELLEGESLESLLTRERRLTIAKACQIGKEAALALSAAHSAGLVHRDIKPANLWLESITNRIKVLDFGLARAAESASHLTTSGAILGTPAYMAPEQARGEPVDARTDLFSLGVVLYRAITGQNPFRGTSSVATLMEVTTHTPPNPRSFCADVPPELSALVMKLIAKVPDDRPSTAREVFEALATIETRTIQAAKQGKVAPKRHPWKAICSGLIAFSFVIAAIILIIRDKDGNKVAEITLANGTSAEFREEPTSAASRSVVNPKIPVETDLSSPTVNGSPTLEEWLKDRKIITVAQDGSGEFTSIQAALKALQPGQAIQVRGPGPYREQLNVPELPLDSGIFSTTDAVIECTEWLEAYKEPDAEGKTHQVYTGHILGHPQGFRLNGLTFTFPPRGMRRVQRMTIPLARGLTIEDCVIRATDGAEAQYINITNLGGPAVPSMTAIIRNCVVESQLWFSTEAPQSRILVEKNLFLDPAGDDHLVIADADLTSAVIRDNVFAGKSESSIKIARLKHCDHLEVVNNSLGGRYGVYFIRNCPKGATIRNNVHFGGGSFVAVTEGAQEERGQLFQREAFDHNAYHTLMISSTGPIAPRQMSGDHTGAVRFLSTEPRNSDYLRVSRTDKSLSEKGAGGDLASYIGALPPGPVGPQGDWFTRLQNRWERSGNSLQPAPSKMMSDPLAEAPDLAEWLKGRTILTVSQDGKGQFKSIQAALNQVESGQAIEVLDRGPYHERLSAHLPADCGIFSRVQTIVDFPKWEPGWTDPAGINGKPAQIYLGYDFVGADRFRLHGIDFHFPSPVGKYEEGHWHQRLTIRTPLDCVIENCCIRRSGLGCADGEPIVLSRWDSPDTTELSAVVRDCVIDGSLVVNTNMPAPFPPDQRRGKLVLKRLVFPAAKIDHHVLVAGQNLQQVTIRQCLFTGNVKHNIALDQMSEKSQVDVTNCYLNGTYGVYFSNQVPEAGVTIRNNIRMAEGIVHFDAPAGKFREQSQKAWRVDHNAYAPVNTPNTPPVSLRPATSDILAKPQYLSTAFGAPDAFRLAAEDRLGQAGIGGDLPTYLGPFPPGPPPAEGDWFTRLQKVCFEGNPPIVKQSSTPIVEPAPLEGWLEGRTILTVAQDGSGQFKTIQAALDALQSGQVVTVLDRGPYRERIELQSPPPDIGLISTVQTRIDLTDMVTVGGQIQSRGHFVNKANRLRIHGFEFQIPQAPANFVTIGIHVSGSRAVVIEHCAIRRANSPGSQSLVIGGIRGDRDEPTVVRECFIEQGMQVYTLGPDGSAIVARNFFTGELHGLMAGGAFQQCVIRNNIFSSTLKFPFIQHVVHADWFELSNNTFFSFPETVLMESLASAQLQERAVRELNGEKNPQLSVERGNAPTGQGAIYNNLHSRPGFLNVTGGAEDEPWTWQIGYNCYPGDGDIPTRNALPRDTNIIANPMFYSIVPHDRDYARLMPDSPGSTSKAGGKWPNYTGALPPGPVPQEGDWFTRLREKWAIMGRPVGENPITP